MKWNGFTNSNTQNKARRRESVMLGETLYGFASSNIQNKGRRRESINVGEVLNGFRPLVDSKPERMEPVRQLFSLDLYEREEPPQLVYVPTFETMVKLMRVCFGHVNPKQLADSIYMVL